MNLYKPVSALSFVKHLLFSLICSSPSERGEECGKKDSSGAVSLKSCTSCTDLDFTRLATTISRKINYDVTQSRPEGAARLHTPKTCSTLSSLTTQNKTGATEREWMGGEEGGMGVFSVSVTSMTQIFHRLQNLLAEVEVPQETCLKFNGRRADVHMRTVELVHIYIKKGMQSSRQSQPHTE